MSIQLFTFHKITIISIVIKYYLIQLPYSLFTIKLNLQEFSRPPIYNPEDYAVSLKKWIGKVSQKVPDQADVTAQTVSNEGEMSLRQFLSISDLLNKLKTDLRLAYLR